MARGLVLCIVKKSCKKIVARCTIGVCTVAIYMYASLFLVRNKELHDKEFLMSKAGEENKELTSLKSTKIL